MKATPKQWGEAGSFASDTRACLLELRARVEALEHGATCPHVVTSDEGTSYCRLAEQASPTGKESVTADSSLVERVADAICAMAYCGDTSLNWRPAARAAIREVAAWLRDRNGYPWAWVAQILELEADR